MVPHHVPLQTKREGDGPNCGGKDLNRENEDTHVPNWTGEVLKVVNHTQFFTAFHVEIDEGEGTKCERGVNKFTRWQETWNQADEVCDPN